MDCAGVVRSFAFYTGHDHTAKVISTERQRGAPTLFRAKNPSSYAAFACRAQEQAFTQSRLSAPYKQSVKQVTLSRSQVFDKLHATLPVPHRGRGRSPQQLREYCLHAFHTKHSHHVLQSLHPYALYQIPYAIGKTPSIVRETINHAEL